MHRDCRLKAAFPGAYTQNGGLITFDTSSIRRTIGFQEPFTTGTGLAFRPDNYGVWVEMPVKYGNNMT